MRHLAQFYGKYRIIDTHGNGLQVGNLLLQQKSCTEVPKMPIEIIGAMTQDQIGYMIESTLDIALMEIGVHEAAKYLAGGQFPPGSMGSNVQAAMDFIRKGGGAIWNSG